MKIKTGDKVKITTGKDRGKEGKVEQALPKKERVVVSGVNLVKKHRRGRSQQDPGGIIEMAAAVNVSNVKLICPTCGEATRVGYEFQGDKKVRVCKECGEPA